VLDAGVHLITKPFTIADLEGALSAVLGE